MDFKEVSKRRKSSIVRKKIIIGTKLKKFKSQFKFLKYQLRGNLDMAQYCDCVDDVTAHWVYRDGHACAECGLITEEIKDATTSV